MGVGKFINGSLHLSRDDISKAHHGEPYNRKGAHWASRGKPPKQKSRWIWYYIVNDYASIDVNFTTKQCIGLTSWNFFWTSYGERWCGSLYIPLCVLSALNRYINKGFHPWWKLLTVEFVSLFRPRWRFSMECDLEMVAFVIDEKRSSLCLLSPSISIESAVAVSMPSLGCLECALKTYWLLVGNLLNLGKGPVRQ